MNKISSDFVPCEYCAVKKLSIDTEGTMIGDVDITNLAKNTTVTLR